MAKERRGLPEKFSLNVSRPSDEPVRWGDYVEEEMGNRERRSEPELAKVVQMPPPATRPVESEPSRLPMDPVVEAHDDEVLAAASMRQRRREPTPKPVKQFQRPLRVQMNLTPETQRMLDGLIDDVRTYSAEKNATMADVYEALILAAYEAREENDFARIRPRGRWGTPTAAAFRVGLKTALQRGIAAHVRKEG